MIIMGDFNAYLNCTKLIKRCDRRALLLQNFVACNNLVSANTLPICKGGSDTFVSYNGMFHSMIDHIVIPKECVDTISDCLISDDALNVSIHRPVLCSLKFPHAERTIIRSADIMYPIKWWSVKDAEIGNYRDCLESLSQGLCTEAVGYETGTQIDKLYDDIVYVIDKATDQCIPRSKDF